ncbi:hypothetical protein [Streptosporangium sp. NBC_01756]|uniref:hypothetical protein n=1 Tax=Streptosporangium sp. NBC_01756 TaxID=2975950 RepID=UPI002DDBD9A2|nr:hypothetical protein [Streptosporangium sp. NBC_01756]WSC84245.1 hypothetical protein OIE48_28145 [Streptosporangium sp. NBC_01756]
MSRKVVGAVAALLLALFAVVHAPLQAPDGRHHEPGLAITLAGGAVLPLVLQQQVDHALPPPGAGPAQPGPGTRVAAARPRTSPLTPAVHDISEPRAPPSGDL